MLGNRPVNAENSKTVLSQAIGQAIQLDYFKQLNNQKGIDELINKKDALHKMIDEQAYNESLNLIEFDDELAQLWLHTGLHAGEQELCQFYLKKLA